MTEIKWQEPPPVQRTLARGKGSKWRDFADALRARPGQWALMSDDMAVSVVTNTVKKGGSPAFRPPGSFEATSRRRADHSYGRGSIWVRYVGTEATRFASEVGQVVDYDDAHCVVTK